MEPCDDGNTEIGDGCNQACNIEYGWLCFGDHNYGESSNCITICGDGKVAFNKEGCDDQNKDDGDGCSSTCEIESGWACRGSPSQCSYNCGDGKLDTAEDCDDNNSRNGDGCSASCGVESGWTCKGAPSLCSLNCGNGKLDINENCDDKNSFSSDGCSAACKVEEGWTCKGMPSSCIFDCGNGVLDSGENCDTRELDGSTCEGYGFTGGDLLCNRECDFDFSQCIGTPVESCKDPCAPSSSTEDCLSYGGAVTSAPDPETGEVCCCIEVETKIPEGCKDGVKQEDEECDDDSHCPSGKACSNSCVCLIDTSRCGDGIFNPDFEECDDDSQCSQGLICNDKCVCTAADTRCGDGVIEGTEECEPPGTNTCNAYCMFRSTSDDVTDKSAAASGTGTTSDDSDVGIVESPQESSEQESPPQVDQGTVFCPEDDIVLREKELEEGFETFVCNLTKVFFYLEGNEHSIIINVVLEEEISVTVESDPQDFVIPLGETQGVDVNGDGVEDISIGISSIIDGVGAISIQLVIHPECGNSVIEEGEDCEPPGTLDCDDDCKSVVEEEVEDNFVVVDDLVVYEPEKQAPPPEFPYEPLFEPQVQSVDVCGNGVVELGEECESNFDCDAGWLCTSCFCMPPPETVCGDGFKEGLEECEVNEDCASYQICRSCSCVMETVASCGNYIIEQGEQCDDGNLFDGDGCSSYCFFERPPQVAAAPVCGDGIIQSPEECEGDHQCGSGKCENCVCGLVLLEPTKPTIPTPPPPPPSPKPQPPLSATIQPYNPQPLQPIQQIPLTYVTPQIPQRSPMGDTGPAAIVVIAAGSGLGWAISRRKKR